MPKLFNLATNKQGLIVFGGKASADYGIVVSEAPTFEQPARKQTIFTVPGRNGAIITQQDSWEDVTRKYRIWTTKEPGKDLATSVNAFLAWLNSARSDSIYSPYKGYIRLEDNFEPDIFRMAYYSGANDVTNEMMQYGESELTFTCRPERFYKEGEDVIEFSSGDWIGNPTLFKSKPLLHIEVASANTTVTLSCGVKSFEVTLDDYVNVDCETMNVYRQNYENKNSTFEGDFIELSPGTNMISVWNASKITIQPRYFTI